MLAELVREQVLARTRQEVPHSVEVQVEEIEEREDVTFVRATMWVETESQKGILIGSRGKMIKAIGDRGAQGDRARARRSTCTWTCRCACGGRGGRTMPCWTGSGSR